MEWRYRCLRCRLWTTEAVTNNHPTAQRALCKACCHRALREFWDLYDERDVTTTMSNEREDVMGARGSQLSRSIEFFRSANLDEARVAYALVKEVMDKRLSQAKLSVARQNAAAATPRKSRSKKATPPGVGVVSSPAPQNEQAAVASA